jgi:DNA-binding NtrC family response regulator
MNHSIPTDVLARLEATEHPAILIDSDYRIQATNRAYDSLYRLAGILGSERCHQVSHDSPVPCDKIGESCPLQATRESGAPSRALHIHHTPRGDEYVDIETRPITDTEGEVRWFLETLRPAGGASPRPDAEGLVGRSPAFTSMLELMQRVAPSNASVLLLGESGTGKEVVARALHQQSVRADGMFVPVECSGLTESLFESELFGHEKGAFTGAHMRKTGLVEAARSGTLFLDEIGDIPLQLQVKLLRLLETGSYRRVGSIDPQQADFRLICATHRDLPAMVASGGFRQDLFFRIASFPIRLPPLRERQGDIPLLAQALLARIAPERRFRLAPEALQCLERYNFPGNVRELRNILERGSLMCDGEIIRAGHIAEVCAAGPETQGAESGVPGAGEILTLEEMERRYLRRVLIGFQGDRKSLAAKLGISERTLFRKLRDLSSRPDGQGG